MIAATLMAKLKKLFLAFVTHLSLVNIDGAKAGKLLCKNSSKNQIMNNKGAHQDKSYAFDESDVIVIVLKEQLVRIVFCIKQLPYITSSV